MTPPLGQARVVSTPFLDERTHKCAHDSVQTFRWDSSFSPIIPNQNPVNINTVQNNMLPTFTRLYIKTLKISVTAVTMQPDNFFKRVISLKLPFLNFSLLPFLAT